MTMSLDVQTRAVGLRAEVQTDWRGLAGLAPRWNALLADSASDTVFLTYEWLAAWWRAYARNRSLLSVAVWDGKDLVGLGPFYVDAVRRLGLAQPYLRFVGDGSWDSDYLDIIARRGREHDVIGHVLDALERHRDRWRWIDLHPVPDTSPCLMAVTRICEQRGWRTARAPIPSLTLPLPRTWADYVQSLHPRVRSKVRAGLAFIDQQVSAPPHALTDAADIDPWLDMLFDL